MSLFNQDVPHSRDEIAGNPRILYLWADNLGRYGNDRAVDEMTSSELRSFNNTLGLPVKRLPGAGNNAMFTDRDLKSSARGEIDRCLHAVEKHLYSGGDAVWPEGLGREYLANEAPELWAYLEQRRFEMSQRYDKAPYRIAA